MDVNDHYISISSASTGDYREKGSKFLAYAFPMDQESQLAELLQSIKNEHPKARHYCYAYRLGNDQYNFRANDDGEPSGTAGKPILAAIDSHALSDILIVVVRYFGGTKLGVSGLINAYRTAANDALSHAHRKDIYVTRNCKIYFEYSHMGKVLDAIKNLNINIVHKELNMNPYVEVAIRVSAFDHSIASVKGYLLGRDVEDINDDTSIPYCTFEL